MEPDGAGATVRWIAPALLLSAIAVTPAQAAEPTEAFAIIVGANRSPTAGVSPLNYADDDALANQRVLELLGAKATVLVALDQDTKDLFPAAKSYKPPTQAELRVAFDNVAQQISTARAQGKGTVLYFFFAGHGDMEGATSFLQLQDARLWPTDLAAALSRVNAGQTHVIIDACYGSRFVAARGPGGRRAALAPGFSSIAGPKWPENTGFLTARSASGQTHEWIEFQAGIFSHEARSGLLGGADVNLDGNITYRELAAFVARANESVTNHKYRPEVVATPPSGNLDTPLVRLPPGPMVLDLGNEEGSRLFVETETGIRWADVHPAKGHNLRLHLPVNMGPLFVMRTEPEAEFRIIPVQGVVRFSEQEAAAPRIRARGAAHEAFRQLFALSFNHANASSYVATKQADARPEVQTNAAMKTWAWALMGLGGATAIAGTGVGISAYGMNVNDQSTGIQRDRVGDQIDGRNRTATLLIGSGLVLAAVGAGFLWWQAQAQPEEIE